jgi:RNA polymerase sigma-70 factor (ECF subfamily)
MARNPKEIDPEGGRGVSLDWDGVIRLFNHRVLVSVLALGVPLDLAEDLCQRTWVRLMELHAEGRLVEVRLPGLAITQARFLALSYLRRESERNQAVDLFGPFHDLQARDPDPEATLLAREQIARAIAVLESCSESARNVFFQTYADPPPSHTVVAARVGLSVQRVRQILCEVRQKMKRAMEDEP